MSKRSIRYNVTIRFNTDRKPIQFHADALNYPRLIEELLGTDESRDGARYAFKLDDGSWTTVDWDDVRDFETKESHPTHQEKK